MSNQEIRNNLIKTRDKIEYLLNKGCSIEDISEKLGIRIGHFREKGSVNWFKKCIISKKSMKKRHIEHPEIFTKQRLNLDEEKIKNLYLSKEMPPYKIANLMNCDTVTIFNRLRKMNVRIRGYSESHLLKTYTGIKKIRRNGLIPEKAYILGVLCGDAWMKKYGIVLSAIDKDFVQEFQRNIKITYGIDCSIRKYVPKNIKWSLQHVVGLYSKLAYEDIRSYGIFNTAEWRVPKDIINSNDTNIIGNFLRGFYDSEGHVNPNYYQLKATNTNEPGIKEVMQLLSKLGIHFITTIKKHKNQRYKDSIELYITGSKSYKLFKRYVGFSIKRKQDKLLQLQNIRPQKRYTKEDFNKVVELSKDRLSHYEISRRTDVIRTTVDKWIKNEEHYSKLMNK